MDFAHRAHATAYILGLGQTGLTLLRSLSRRGIPVIALHDDPWEPATASRHGRIVLLPPLAHHENRWVEYLLWEGNEHGGGVIFPSTDELWLFLVRHQKALAPHFRFALPASARPEQLPSKRLQGQLAARAGIPTPRTWYPQHLAEVEQISSSIRFPCLVKPDFSHLGRAVFHAKVRYVRDVRELLSTCRLAAEQNLSVIIQEFVPGGDDQIYCFDSYTGRDSSVRVGGVSHRLRQWPPLFGVSCLSETVVQPRVMELGSRLLREMKFHGMSQVEFKYDLRDGEFRFIEVNVRAPLMMRVHVESGLDIPYVAYCDLCGEPPIAVPAAQKSHKIANWEAYLLSFLIQRRHGGKGCWDWFAPLVRGTQDLYFAADDLGPFLKWLRRFQWRLRHAWVREQLERYRSTGLEDVIRLMHGSAAGTVGARA